jgi:hypothetical protein
VKPLIVRWARTRLFGMRKAIECVFQSRIWDRGPLWNKVAERNTEPEKRARTMITSGVREFDAVTIVWRILFTDNHRWKIEEIIPAYYSQHHVEAAFRTTKNPYFVAGSPSTTGPIRNPRARVLLDAGPDTCRTAARRSRRTGLELSFGARCRELFPSAKSSISTLRFRGAAFARPPPTTSLRLSETLRLNERKTRW